MLPVDQRVAGLIMPRLDADFWTDPAYRDAAYRLVDRGVGGFGVFKGTLEQTAIMLQELQQRAGNRLIFGADYEYGLPMRITDGAIAMPRAMALGRGSAAQTEAIAAAVAQEMHALGIHWNWAPVADINSDPMNPIINVRSFGETPDVVCTHVEAWVRGTQAHHVMACLKHAPGHGATSVDSHVDLPTITISAERASRREFRPFRAGIKAGAGSLMMGHLLIPFLDAKHPGSLSAAVVTGLVRNTWGFNGIIVTDALDMGAITKRYSPADAAVRAFLAGNDVLLLPADVDAAISGLEQATRRGKITEQRLLASEDRWQSMRKAIRRAPPSQPVDQASHANLALQAASNALHIEGDHSVLPITQYQQAAVFAVVSDHEAMAATQWLHFLAQATEMDMDVGYIDGTITPAELEELAGGIVGAHVVVFALFGAAVANRGKLPGTENLPHVFRSLSAGRKSIIVACGSPYGIENLPADATLMAFSDTTPSLAATVLRLTGKLSHQSA